MKGLRYILILIIAINIILITYMLFFVKPIHEYTYEEYRISVEGENPELEAALKIRIFPENREQIEEKYNGNINLNYFYEKLFDIVHNNLVELQNETKDLNVNELNNYLQNNKQKLLAGFGIINIEQLSKFANNIKGYNIDDSEYVSSSIVENSYVEAERYDSFDIVINYRTCKFYLKVYIANDMLLSPMVLFDIQSGGEV